MTQEQKIATEQATEKPTVEAQAVEKPAVVKQKRNEDITTIAITKNVRNDLMGIKKENKDKSLNETIINLIKMHNNGGKNKASPVPETETLNPATAQ